MASLSASLQSSRRSRWLASKRNSQAIWAIGRKLLDMGPTVDWTDLGLVKPTSGPEVNPIVGRLVKGPVGRLSPCDKTTVWVLEKGPSLRHSIQIRKLCPGFVTRQISSKLVFLRSAHRQVQSLGRKLRRSRPRS